MGENITYMLVLNIADGISAEKKILELSFVRL